MHMLSFPAKRNFNPAAISNGLAQQWNNPTDVFSVLLILGGGVVAKAIVQLAGSRVAPVAFSFGMCIACLYGWVAYSVPALVNLIGDNELMPAADCPYKVFNAYNGLMCDTFSWAFDQLVRDF
ncbi:hypothetical protein GGR55DRAFT_591640 [Xylaria sp. FL0064]|nr:hypothetical protein GGR55DRAFT_591640 [Xylaria sp. FL0064]